MKHVPVLEREILHILAPLEGETVLDCTLGLGGHAAAFLRATAPDGHLVGLDADRENLAVAAQRLALFDNRIDLRCMNFRDAGVLTMSSFDIVFADLGLSSPHVDDPGRGFTFRTPAPLDLRYDRSGGQTAAELLRSTSEDGITKILQNFGELPRSRSLARTLHAHFRSTSCTGTTDDVVHCVTRIFTYRAPAVLPQVFQALRIAVNDELGALQSLLNAVPVLLKPGGRCGIISYHSLEDRLVKRTFRSLATPVLDERTGQVARAASWNLLTRKGIVPSAQEVAHNPRSRSARFRALVFLTSH